VHTVKGRTGSNKEEPCRTRPPRQSPSGPAVSRRQGTQPALHAVTMEAVIAKVNVARAWARVKSNRGAPGIDGMHVENFAEYARTGWPATRQALLAGCYQPQPVRRVSILKPGGGERELGIPTVMDRVIQQALAQIMTPVFDPGFSESSHGFRPRRSAHDALKQVQSHIQAGHRIAVDLDLRKFFDNVGHDILMAFGSRRGLTQCQSLLSQTRCRGRLTTHASWH